MTTTSAEVDQLYSALVDAQGEFGAVAKTADNPFFKSKYADLATIMRETQPVLTRHGLAVTMPPGRGTIFARLVHKSGQWQESEMDLVAPKADPQGQGSAITYARRYAYCSVLGIITEVDDDGASASGRVVAPKGARAPQAASAGQLRMLAALLSENGCGSREDRLAFASAVIGRPLTSSKELTTAEAAQIIEKLRRLPPPEVTE